MKIHIRGVLTAGIVASSSMLLLQSCVAAQNQPLPSVTKIESGLTEKTQKVMPRALWVWDATVITNPQQQNDLFDFCAKKGVSVVYVSVGDIFSTRQRETTDPKHITAPMLGQFLRAAHERKLQVEALDGDPSFSLEAKHADALARLQKALDYNKAAKANEKLDGFQWDTEPYLLAEFKESPESQQRVLKQYLDSASQMRDAVKASPSLRLGYAIPSFFDAANRSLEWNGTTKAPAFHLMDILNTVPSSYVAIMAYRDKALGSNGSIEISRGEADYATKSAPNVKVWIGQETLDVKGDPPSITFWQEGETVLESALGEIQAAYKDQPSVAGLAIHHWASYRILKAGEPSAIVPVTAPLTILSPKNDDAVERRAEVSGTGNGGAKVAVAVRPKGDKWYPQGEMPLAADGTWNVVCRFGNEKTPAGREFEVRAQLLKEDGTVLTEQIVKVKTK